MDQQNKQKIQINFVTYEIKNNIVFYKIVVKTTDTDQNWEFRSRYSIMRDVHKDIVAIVQDESQLPQFPKKKWFGNTDKAFIEQRQKELQHYFSSLLQLHDIKQLPPLEQFLYKDKPPVIPSDKPVIIKDDSKKNIVDDKKIKEQDLLNSQQEQINKIIQECSQQFVPLVVNFSQLDEQFAYQKKQEYSEKIKTQKVNVFFNKFTISQGKAQNVAHVYEVSKFISDQTFVSKFEKFADNIANILQKPESNADASKLVYPFI